MATKSNDHTANGTSRLVNQSSRSKLIPVGCDDGHFSIKICAGPNVEDFFSMQSRAKFGRAGVSSISGATANDLIYETSPGEYVTITADDLLGDAQDTRTLDYPTSSPNRALVAHALRRKKIVNEVFLVSGLPVNRFYLDGERNTTLIDGKRESLMRPVLPLSGELPPKIVEHKVVSEATAAYLDCLINFDGTYNAEFKQLSDEEAIAVVDVGGRTLDIAVIKEGGTGVYQNKSGTADVGCLFVYDELESDLLRNFDGKDAIPFNRLVKTLNTGTYSVYSKKFDVSEIVNNLLDRFAERIAFESKKLLGDASSFGRVIFVGGGANVLHSRLDMVFPHLPAHAVTCAPMSDDPRVNSTYANVRGMYKAALLEI